MTDRRRIYLDFDDVLCRTAEQFLPVVAREFDKHYTFEQIHAFNLRASFELSDTEYEHLMRLMHEPEILGAMRPMAGMTTVVHGWLAEGSEVHVVTGRPADTVAVSRDWLDRHALEAVGLMFVDKYARSHGEVAGVPVYTLDELAAMHFDLAVEDSPLTLRHLVAHTDWPVIIFDRPWNRTFDAIPAHRNVTRCTSWEAVGANAERLKTDVGFREEHGGTELGLKARISGQVNM